VPDLECWPLTTGRWGDLERLFGPRGASGGCWCMWFRLTGAEFRAGAGDANRAALRRLVDTGAPTGLLAYRDGVPVGWCAVAPRRDQPRLARSPLVRAAEARRPALEPVWAVTCLYLPPRPPRTGGGPSPGASRGRPRPVRRRPNHRGLSSRSRGAGGRRRRRLRGAAPALRRPRLPGGRPAVAGTPGGSPPLGVIDPPRRRGGRARGRPEAAGGTGRCEQGPGAVGGLSRGRRAPPPGAAGSGRRPRQRR